MAAAGQKGKYPVRITLFVTEEMDDKIDMLASVMNITKSEWIRYQLGTTLVGFDMAKNEVAKLAKNDVLEGQLELPLV